MSRFSNICCLVLLALAIGIGLADAAPVARDQEIRTAVTAFVMSRTNGMGWDVHVRKITIAEAVKLPEGAIDYEIVAPQQWEGWGNVSIAVVARQKERILRNIPVRVEVEALADMVVATRQLDMGTIVAESDLVVQKRELSQGAHLLARKLEDVVGKKNRSTIRANQPLRIDQLEKVPLIKAGQLITIVAENESLKVSVAGKARSSGAEGDTIKVQNLSSLKEISAQVLNANTVQVPF
jgi:flagella basal body P-ring formation protein FlgA